MSGAALALAYFALLAAAYARAGLTLVYPVARGSAPVLVLIVSVAFLGAPLGRWQAAVAARGGDLRRALTPPAVLAGIGMFAAYALTLAALERAEAAPVAALRETSVVMAALAAVLLGREAVRAPRLAGAAVVVTGAAAIALG